MTLSIIIPIYNEAPTIGALLTYLKNGMDFPSKVEIIVVDGGSTDASRGQVAKFSDIRFFVTAKGRALQMNFGAEKAKGRVLYFLHADSYPPHGFDRWILQAADQGNQAGCFCMKFDDPHWWLRLAGWFTQFNVQCCRGGDQSLFITTALFRALDGYDTRYRIYEDNEFINRIYTKNRFTVLQHWLTTSARRYRSYGIWSTQYHFWMIHLLRRIGAPPERLYGYYQKYLRRSPA